MAAPEGHQDGHTDLEKGEGSPGSSTPTGSAAKTQAELLEELRQQAEDFKHTSAYKPE